MIISLLGRGSETLLSDFDSAGIEYIRRYPPVGVISNAGETIQIVKDSIPWAALATVLVAWFRARASRKLIITQGNNEIFHSEGLSVKEIERLLPQCKNIVAIETKKPEE